MIYTACTGINQCDDCQNDPLKCNACPAKKTLKADGLSCLGKPAVNQGIS